MIIGMGQGFVCLLCVCLQVLDQMLLYLRIVYSFDYYSTVEYPHEDAMPHRCGIFHARGPQPKGRVLQHDCKFLASTSSIEMFLSLNYNYLLLYCTIRAFCTIFVQSVIKKSGQIETNG